MIKFAIIFCLISLILIIRLLSYKRAVIIEYHFTYITLGFKFGVDEIDFISGKKTYFYGLRLLFVDLLFIPISEQFVNNSSFDLPNELINFVPVEHDLYTDCKYYLNHKRVSFNHFMHVCNGYSYKINEEFIINRNNCLVQVKDEKDKEIDAYCIKNNISFQDYMDEYDKKFNEEWKESGLPLSKFLDLKDKK